MTTQGAPIEPLAFSIAPGTLRALLKALEPTCGKNGAEVRVDVSRDGLAVAHMKPDNVAYERVRVSARVLMETPGPSSIEGEGSFFIDTLKLRTLAKVAGKLPIRLEVPSDRRHIISRAGFATYTGSLCDPDGSSDPKEPSPDPGTFADGADPDAFFRAVRDAAAVAGRALINRTKDTVAITAAHDDDDPNRADTSGGELTVGTLTGAGSAEYPLDVLGAVGSSVRGADSLRLEFGRGRPLAVRFELGGVGAGVSGVYWVAPYVPDDRDDAPECHYWYDWAMRPRLPPDDPSYPAAAVDTLPDDVVREEVERVRVLNLEAEAAHAAQVREYGPKAEEYRAQSERYEEARVAFVSRWRETHPKEPAHRTVRQNVGDRPCAPMEPQEFRPTRPFDNVRRGHAYEDPEEERDRRRDLRGRVPGRVDWVYHPRAVEPAEPVDVPALSWPEPTPGPGSIEASAADQVPAFEVPIVRLEAPDPRPEVADRPPAPAGPAPPVPEDELPAPTPVEGPEGPLREPDPGPFVGQSVEPTPEPVRAVAREKPPSRRKKTNRTAARSIAAQIVPPAPVEPVQAPPAPEMYTYSAPVAPELAPDPEPVMGDPLPHELQPAAPVVETPAIPDDPPAAAPPADPATAPGPVPTDRHGHPRLTRGFMRRDWRRSPPGGHGRAVPAAPAGSSKGVAVA